MKKKGLISLAVAGSLMAATFAGFATGCGDGSKGGNGSITIWAPQEEQLILPEMIEKFKEAYPEYKDVKFNYQKQGVNDVIDTVKKDKGVAADVFMYPSGGITELRNALLINPIRLTEDDSTNGMSTEMTDMFGANAIEAVIMKEKDNDGNDVDRLFGIPLTLNTFFMYYNSDYYTEDEVDSLETMMSKDFGEDCTNFSIALRDSWYISAFFCSEEDQLTAPTDATIECLYNGEYGYKVGEYLLDLKDNPKFFDATGSGNDGEEFNKGKLGALCSGTWSASDLKAALGDKLKTAPLPTIEIDGNKQRLSPFGDYKAYGINSDTSKRTVTVNGEKVSSYAIANLVVQWLGNATCQDIRFEANGDSPTHIAIKGLDKIKNNVGIKGAAEQEQYCTNQPRTSMLTYYWDAVKSFGTNLMGKDNGGNPIVTIGNLQEHLNRMVNDIKHIN